MAEDNFLKKQSTLYRDLTRGNPMLILKNIKFLIEHSSELEVDPEKNEISISEFNFAEYTVIQNGEQVSNKTFCPKEEALVIKYYNNIGTKKKVYLFRSEI